MLPHSFRFSKNDEKIFESHSHSIHTSGCLCIGKALVRQAMRIERRLLALVSQSDDQAPSKGDSTISVRIATTATGTSVC